MPSCATLLHLHACLSALIICSCHTRILSCSAFAAFDSSPPPPTPPNDNRNHDAHHRSLQRRDLIGLWRLTAQTAPSALPKLDEGSGFRPVWMMADDTSSDGDNESNKGNKGNKGNNSQGGILLMLKDDGSFVQYGAVNERDEAAASSSQKSSTSGIRRWGRRGKREGTDPPIRQVFQGTWNFDGRELILASDRPQMQAEKDDDDYYDQQQQQKQQQQQQQDMLQVHDTMFSGEVTLAQINEAPADDSLPTELLDDTCTNQQDANDNKLVQKEDIFLSIRNGIIGIGNFMYPRGHPSFFEKPNAPIFQPQHIGTFELRQMMGVLNAFNTDQNEDTVVEPKFRPEDFYGKTFLLTSEPIQMKRAKPKLKWSKRTGGYVKEKDGGASIVDQQPFDLRAMPIEFFRNNTFQAIGSGKILRGRFGLEGAARDKLWFAVSLFGAGRSAPGSVYSEGPGLTHEDERSYIGDIELWERGKANEGGDGVSVEENYQSSTRAIFVGGAITVGQDMGTDTRAIPVATFTMREVIDRRRTSTTEEDYRDEDNVDSVFE